MKEILLLSVFIFFAILSSCQNSFDEKIAFNNKFFSLSYPSSWVKNTNEEHILAFTKYGQLEKLLHGGSPNIIVAKFDSIQYYSTYQIKNIEQLLNWELKNDGLKKIKRLQKVRKIKLSQDSIYMTKILINSVIKTTIQYQYAYSYDGNYIVLYATHDSEEEDSELHEIVNSLKTKKYQSLEESL